MKVLITGGTGLVGRRLAARLLARGDTVVVLSRDATRARRILGERGEVLQGDPSTPGAWQSVVGECDAVVHLAGENLFARRWSEAQKRIIEESRTRSTALVAEAVAKAARKPVLVSASAVGFYGPRDDDARIDEAAPPGNDFLARVCQAWEKACEPAQAAGTRVVLLRTGVVLDAAGGALAAMLPPFRMFVGGPAGSGKQWMSWVHADDLVGLVLFALDDARVTGPLNGVAPEPATMHDFSKALGRALGRPSWAPVPGFALRLLLGEVADVILTGQRVTPRKALDLGYVFKHPEVGQALASALRGDEQAAVPLPRVAS